jgi:hypothetical protein
MRARGWTTIAWTILAFLIPGVLRADHRPPEVIATVPVTGTNLAVDADADRVYVSSPTELTVLDGRTSAIAGTLAFRARHEVVGVPGDQVRDGTVPVATGAIDVNPATDRVYIASQHLYVIDGSALEVSTAIPGKGSGFFAVGVNSRTNTVYATFWSRDGAPSLAVIDGYTNRVTNVAPYGGILLVDEDADRVYLKLGQDVVSLDGRGRLIGQRRFDRDYYGSLVVSQNAHEGGFFVAYPDPFPPPSGLCPVYLIDSVDGLTLHSYTEVGLDEIGDPRVLAANPVTGRFYLHWVSYSDPSDCSSDGHASSMYSGTYVTVEGGGGAWALWELEGHQVRDIEINPVSGRGYVLRGSAVVVVEGHHPED